ncbi:hypothetical protein A3A39_01980 [Candidatus Kaiserbacteria bacterium RIFCSPLOWO2_01_FULL_54_13]|uniref:Uncharacterized protein n=1 Tax=Candidatus Kaiserbacteria bacterium RIFCSPLOWO2_01_FULL_54_13 TaxID=1798512 RepID=A0A1F6F0I2_9BACT|nr:MAG: hypothetical protein A3A39_01980 [Candidatus Kaiserbacteria bacterium RIFCSPLOWO2_01_FULL_54_13]
MRKALIVAALAALLSSAPAAAGQVTVEVGYVSAIPIENESVWSAPYQIGCALSYFEYASRGKTAKFLITCQGRRQVYTFQSGDRVIAAFVQECRGGNCQSLMISLRLDELKDDGSAAIDVDAKVFDSPKPAPRS